MKQLLCVVLVVLSHFVFADIPEKIKPYIIDSHHPAKIFLDSLMYQERLVKSKDALKAAGFKNVKPREHTRVIVTEHPLLPGYLLKLYLDPQQFHKQRPDWETWYARIRGAELLRDEIAVNGWENWFRVPNKWIYQLPEVPAAEDLNMAKNYILVVEKLDIHKGRNNLDRWHSDNLSERQLKAFFYLITRLGLWDCAKPENSPFCKDGKIAFIDTESWGEWPVEYEKLTRALSMGLRGFWKNLAANSNKVPKRKEE